MSDRRASAQAPATAGTMYAPPQQWQNNAQYPPGYAGSPTAAGYPSSSYSAHQQNPHSASSYSMAQTSPLPTYQTSDTRSSYTHDRSPTLSGQPSPPYPPVDRNGVPLQPPPPVQTQYTYTPPHPHPPPHSMPPYATPQSPHPNGVPGQHPPHPQYPPPAPYAPPPADAASQYPASPQRPFSCDMCALSFNRQHDLKRHRDTHTGEKPFLCNGGCGKTFTRKDALKRHQLVKRCGIDEGA
ncbi:C2H2-type zinc finger protein [Phanerochaete sordida]|uniref:C2H2-type zinc finger protein n=1 Tax=Phanerochaete sordida TaxID=48140 RepID=A0A9P3GA48_9APHY|nr:C2H2-type zinc finger protein [Phanerochaete sordida]